MNHKLLKPLILVVLSILFLGFTSCKQKTENKDEGLEQESPANKKDSIFFKLSLAQWSLHELIYDGELAPMDFARTAHEMGFEGVEYVSTFYSDSIKD